MPSPILTFTCQSNCVSTLHASTIMHGISLRGDLERARGSCSIRCVLCIHLVSESVHMLFVCWRVAHDDDDDTWHFGVWIRFAFLRVHMLCVSYLSDNSFYIKSKHHQENYKITFVLNFLFHLHNPRNFKCFVLCTIVNNIAKHQILNSIQHNHGCLSNHLHHLVNVYAARTIRFSTLDLRFIRASFLYVCSALFFAAAVCGGKFHTSPALHRNNTHTQRDKKKQ